MNNRIDKDWTDALRETLEGASLTPSEGGWQRLRADLHPRKSVHWPYYVLTAVAACAAICGVFLFRGQSPSGPGVEVMESAGLVADVPQAVEEIVPSSVPTVRKAVRPEEPEALPAGESAPEPVVKAVEQEVVSEVGTIEVEEKAVVEEKLPEAEIVPFVDDFPVEESAPRRSRRKLSVAFSAGGAFGSSSGRNLLAHRSAPLTRAGDVMDITEVIQHSTPVSARMDLFIPLSSRLGIGTGLDLSSHKSSVGDAVQTMKWLGLPLKLDYNVGDWGPYRLSVGAGIKGEKCLFASLLGMDFNESFQWAANVGADCRVSLFGPVSLLVSPELDYYFTDTVLPTYRTGRPLSFGISAGLSFNL